MNDLGHSDGMGQGGSGGRSGIGGFRYEVGQVVGAVSARVEASQTKPPSRYTEDTLIDDMLAAHKFAKNDAEREILKKTEGLGTSRTRETIIKTLVNRQYVTCVKKGKSHQLISTDLGQAIINNLPNSLTDVATTAKWEVALGMIERGEVDPQLFMQKLHAYVHQIVAEAREKKLSTSRQTFAPPATAGAKPGVPTARGAAPGGGALPMARPNHSLPTSRGALGGAQSR